jgi:hypothetical protein
VRVVVRLGRRVRLTSVLRVLVLCVLVTASVHGPVSVLVFVLVLHVLVWVLVNDAPMSVFVSVDLDRL